MSLIKVACQNCGETFSKDKKHYAENLKLDHKFYCSPRCSAEYRKIRISLICENPNCENAFERISSEVSKHNYCSRSCAVIVNNSKYPKNPGEKKICPICNRVFVSRKIYCSRVCHAQSQVINSNKLLSKIKMFYGQNGRIPFKREFLHYHSARNQFGSWNKAIKAAGFSPNPVMFAKKYIANDGHKCDSLAEKIIDDWLHRKNIPHKRNVKYPEDYGLTVDFVVYERWIEFFGLSGQHKRYDELKNLKIKLANKHKLNLVEIYPEDLFPEFKLGKILNLS